MLQDQQLELEQRLEGIDVDLLQCIKGEASKRVEDCEGALANSRAHVNAAETACKLAAAEQKLLDEKIQVAHVRLYAQMESVASLTLAREQSTTCQECLIYLVMHAGGQESGW